MEAHGPIGVVGDRGEPPAAEVLDTRSVAPSPFPVPPPTTNSR
jgi:hypothetical protein